MLSIIDFLILVIPFITLTNFTKHLLSRTVFSVLLGIFIGITFVLTIQLINSTKYIILQDLLDDNIKLSKKLISNINAMETASSPIKESSSVSVPLSTNIHTNFDYIIKNQMLANELKKDVKILCWILTHPANHKTRLPYIKQTWGNRCDKLLLISSEEDPEVGTIAVPFMGEENHDRMWNKTKEAFQYVYHNYINEYDWFLKTDDDTYVIMENLRFLLNQYSPNDPIQFGCRFHIPNNPEKFYMAGSAYVLSRGAVKLFIEESIPNPDICRVGEGAEDVEIGICLNNVNVTVGDARDEIGKQRFFPFTPEVHIIPNYWDETHWYWSYRVDGSSDYRSDNISSTAISFHYILGEQMLVYDYLLYNISIYGISTDFKALRKT